MADDEEYHLADALEDISMTPPVDQTSHQALRDDIDQALNVLSPRERTIIEMRYGLKDGHTFLLMRSVPYFILLVSAFARLRSKHYANSVIQNAMREYVNLPVRR